MTTKGDLFQFSQGLADAVEKAGSGTVLVNARRKFPATGVLFRSEYVLTADHVIERDDDLHVVFPDGAEREATIAGRDPSSDLAVLRFTPVPDLAVVEMAEMPRVGEIVLALGRPGTSGLQASLGIVSALSATPRGLHRRRRETVSRRLGDVFIYTDATPFPGFSGGPLVNAAGEMVGLNTSGLLPGRSVAIPARAAAAVGDILATKGSIRKGYLGVRSQLSAIDSSRQGQLGREQEAGLLIVWVEAGSPAGDGGLLVGDILVRIGEDLVEDHHALQAVLYSDVAGSPVEVEVLRGDRVQKILITIGETRA